MPPDDLPAEEPQVPPEVLERLRLFVEREAQQRRTRPPAGTVPPCGCGLMRQLLRQPDPNAPQPRVIYRTTLGEIAARSGQGKPVGNVLSGPWGKAPPKD